MAGQKIRPMPPSTLPTLSSALSYPWDFLHPTDDLHALIAGSTKRLLDPLATSVAEEQTDRRQSSKKRKRPNTESDVAYLHLQLKTIYVDGFTPNQIWEQATRILESAGGEVERNVTLLSQYDDFSSNDSAAEESLESADVSSSDEIVSESDAADGLSDKISEYTNMEDTDERLGDSDQEELEGAGAVEESPSDDDEVSMDSDQDSDQEDSGTYVEDRFGLNDGFFSIDDFNKQSEFLERQDAKGQVDDADDSEEEVDWHADPSAARDVMPEAKGSASSKPRGSDDEEMDYSSDEEGPTFGNADLHGDSEEDFDDDTQYDGEADATDWVDTSDIKYAGFFAPPPRKASSKRARALPKTHPTEPIMDDDVDRAMADVRRDLFDDESEGEGEGGAADESGGLQAPRSTHEKQRARIADEIRRLEAENVAKKAWMLTGEARAIERPVNSLIEEDLDFERVGKPVPVVTNETTEDIEDLVKRRILAKEFDEVIRRRPGTTDTKTPRGNRFELEDTKPQQSLAQIYETDHLRAADPNYVDSKDRKLMRQHTEVTNLWKVVSSQLDILSNWHYKPKSPQAVITSVNDVATISMEDARPTAGSAAGGPSALAPQEIYAPGDDGRTASEVVLKTGATISKDEMSREEKNRLRRQKKSQRKVDSERAQQSSKATEKQQLVSDLKKGGVKVVTKEGQVTDMNGGRVGAGSKTRADVLKL
ncbi:uncharacterized protein N7459_009802 [Penicillium hispanicum]|uniref:uncharacterized protein n=1 Tax=Penicillium hispanicum TaxID=1080232 RepID=UPI00254056B0|nr:uncharacterized protein N7459_009802 [Penicillium hispanicum]KAJ5570372.1 hypothetical protein N7459_009802 [Penicillium hispanicum]